MHWGRGITFRYSLVTIDDSTGCVLKAYLLLYVNVVLQRFLRFVCEYRSISSMRYLHRRKLYNTEKH
jgi:hypothetical protein